MLRKTIIILLTLAAVGTAVIGLTSCAGGGHAPRSSSQRGTYVPPSHRDFSLNPRYKLFVKLHRGNVCINRESNYCLTCGRLSPDHSVFCWQRRVFDYFDYRKLRDVRILGFGWRAYISAGERHDKVEISLWLPFLLFVTYPAIAFIRGPLRRHGRREKGLCVRCGYDLTGNASGVCPECGKEIVGQVADLPDAARGD